MKRYFQSKTDNTYTVVAGLYLLGDPCYAIAEHKNWLSLLTTCEYFNEPIGHLVDGIQVLALSTIHGDGCYVDNYGNDYPVDAGLIGLVPATAGIHKIGLNYMVEFKEDTVACLADRYGKRYLIFDKYRIALDQD